MKKLLSILAISAILVACSDGYNDKNDEDGKDTTIVKRDSTVKDTSVIIRDTAK